MSPETMLLLGAGLVFAALLLVLTMFGVIFRERQGVARTLSAIKAIDTAPAELRKDLDLPFYERVLLPLGDQLVDLGKRLTRADTVERLKYRLDVAGNPPGWDVNRIIGLKAVGLLSLGGLAFLYCVLNNQPILRSIVITALMSAAGFVLPNILLHNAGQKRELLMQNSLPDALDLMTISVEAGLGFDAALQRVARDTTGPLAAEFSRLTQEMQIGTGRTEAMRNMAERSTLKDLRGFALAMVQADSFGIPVAKVLRVQSQEMRTRRRQRAEEQAQQVPVKMLFPLIFFILPCLFIVVLGPAILQMSGVFSQVR